MKTYLDTDNWYDLADGKVTNEPFEHAVAGGCITPVLSFVHVYEFARAEKRSRTRVIEYIRKVKSLGTVKWIASMPYVIQKEVQNSFLVACGFPPKSFSVFVDDQRQLPELALPWVLTCDPSLSLESLIEHFANSSARREGTLRSHLIFNFSLLRELQQATRRLSESNYVTDLAFHLLPRTIQTASGHRISPDSEQLNQFKTTFKLEECPALSLLIAFFKGWSLTSGGETGSEAEDCFHLVGLAYCDVAFSDKRVRDCLSKTARIWLPRQNAEFSTWVGGIIQGNEETSLLTQ